MSPIIAGGIVIVDIGGLPGEIYELIWSEIETKSDECKAMLPSRKRQKTAWVEGPAADSLVQAITTENSLIQAVATEQSLAAPTVGGPDILPGFWANRAKECPWPKGARIVLTAGTLLFQLVALPLKKGACSQTAGQDKA
ncbi:uncharacterized protein N7446_005433 [Penicillium canescens]|uniref:uncharacterized protein n=1 Tax=Penicillium canescens TaxID=5083 RepID=UPI0026DF474E|nr:uncharacterized protein N7446_005433 [Penicillium canescens]KAJ6061313.1 hypothetical protein N7446_005433 [Penicillium canescens]